MSFEGRIETTSDMKTLVAFETCWFRYAFRKERSRLLNQHDILDNITIIIYNLYSVKIERDLPAEATEFTEIKNIFSVHSVLSVVKGF